MKFTDHVVLVAGGTTGINFAVAKAFAVEGAKVCVLSRSQTNVDTALEELTRVSASVMGRAADVRDTIQVSEAVAQVVSAWGDIDILVSGAAGNFVSPLSAMSSNGFKTVVDIDLLGSFNVMGAVYPHLKKPGASIVNISAPQSQLPTPAQAHVCAAKAGIDQLTRTAAMEWGPEGIRVNAISPGPIDDTEGMKRLGPTEESRKKWEQSVPLRRYGSKDEIADAAKWLCSPQASYISGVILPVDGGWSLGGSSAMTTALS
ncbi:SDR family oxidoreductase [Spongiibacter nanhainus]|uniref:SDR family oxidoreductase n=1 Tax=Spongiibacter nanhainus TaxID=2794344 RepID=A0A7T4R2N4_9GAMM|nr:SDR family oxidoreductase [Spongiibacter nanhainus]QQD19144.1 SDR family oxidoreductase [Spongiibacter nanhainus]